MQIILASASPRRQELLKNIFTTFTVHTSSCEENTTFENPAQYVTDLALQKASDVAAHHIPAPATDEILIIGADTIVYNNGVILGKPANRAEAYQMLQNLSGKTHEVYTGFALIHIKGTQTDTHSSYDCTRVHVESLSNQEIDNYIDGPENVYDKAGSYAIQGYFSRHISGIEGDYFNVVGLPVNKIYQELKKHQLL